MKTVVCLVITCAFSPTGISKNTYFKRTIRVVQDSGGSVGGNAISKNFFVLAEVFGKISNGLSKVNGTSSNASQSTKKLSVAAMAELIRSEYEKIFWATGNMDISLWQENCTFADPFSSFSGPGSVIRFRDNANNLGKLVIDPKIRITSASTTDSVVSIGWTFSSKLKLPWKPVLAASGVTKHFLNKETNLIERYEESWKSKPLDVVLRLLVPT
eukprot:gene7767-15895_t